MAFVGAPLGPVGPQRSPTVSRLVGGWVQRANRWGSVGQLWETSSKLTTSSGHMTATWRIASGWSRMCGCSNVSGVLCPKNCLAVERRCYAYGHYPFICAPVMGHVLYYWADRDRQSPRDPSTDLAIFISIQTGGIEQRDGFVAQWHCGRARPC